MLLIMSWVLAVGNYEFIKTGMRKLPCQYISDVEWCDNIRKHVISGAR